MQNFPLVQWASRHPRVSAWLVLSVGMVALVAYEGRDVGLQVLQWIALIVACVLTAGACIWIISWEDATEPVTASQEMPAVSVPDEGKSS